jgi:hypothetical protein
VAWFNPGYIHQYAQSIEEAGEQPGHDGKIKTTDIKPILTLFTN